jgi:hypothetical protein
MVVNASSSTGRELTYDWTSSDPRWTIVNSGSTSFLTAPPVYNSTTVITVTVTDEKGLFVSTQNAVTTGAPRPPNVTAIAIAPNPLVPGGTATLLENASSPIGNPLTYHWTVADPAWSLTDGSAIATLTAPRVGGARTLVTATVTDPLVGLSSSVTSIVTTGADRTPRVVSMTWSPLNPMTRIPVNLRAVVAPSDQLVAAWSWALVSAPAGSTATLSGANTASPQFTPDVAGGYLFSLILTDQNGVATDAVLSNQMNVVNPSPRAFISGPSPVSGAIGSAIALDGSRSSAPSGNALTYRWTASATPAGATASFFADAALTVAGASVPQTYFVGNLPGTYTLLLTVTDVITNLTATASVQVILVAPGLLTVASGGHQAAAVGSVLPDPLVLQLFAADGTTPVAGQTVRAVASNGQLGSNSLVTDANGQVSLFVQAGRLARSGTVQAWVPGAAGVAPISTSFDVLAGPATGLSLEASPGRISSGATLTIQSVDRYGNRALDNASAATASVHVVATSASGQAHLETSDVTLANGFAEVGLTDAVAENVTVTMTAPGLGLPISAWQSTIDDAGAIAFGSWTSGVLGANAPFALQTDPLQIAPGGHGLLRGRCERGAGAADRREPAGPQPGQRHADGGDAHAHLVGHARRGDRFAHGVPRAAGRAGDAALGLRRGDDAVQGRARQPDDAGGGLRRAEHLRRGIRGQPPLLQQRRLDDVDLRPDGCHCAGVHLAGAERGDRGRPRERGGPLAAERGARAGADAGRGFGLASEHRRGDEAVAGSTTLYSNYRLTLRA